MNLKAAYKYQLKDNVLPITIFYISVIIFYSFIFIIFFNFAISLAPAHNVQATTNTSGLAINNYSTVSHSSFGGMSGFIVVFLFILALNSFKDNFKMLIQNGLSRKAVMISRTITTLTIAGALVIIDEIITLIFKALAFAAEGNVTFDSVFEQTYKLTGLHPVVLHLNIMFYDFFLYLCVMALGYFITLLFYRLNRIGKIAVGAGVPIFICVILPILDRYADNQIYKGLSVFADTIMGIDSSRPLYAMISYFIIYSVFTGICWLLIRRSPLKE